jgi:hypothetical protein
VKKIATGTSKPIGVSILAVLNIMVGIFGILSGITIDFILVGGDLTLVGTYQLGTLIIGIMQILAGFGLWKLQSWAWWLGAIVTLIGLVINLLIVFADFALWNTYILVILIRIVILWYLLQVKYRFS